MLRMSIMITFHPSVNIFKRLHLWNLWANFAQISYGASLGWGGWKIAKMVAVHDHFSSVRPSSYNNLIK